MTRNYFWLFIILVFLSTGISGDANNDNKLTLKTGYIEIGEAKLYYEEMGQGHPLIMIHGGLLDRRMWDDQFEVFAKHYRAIRYDVRNHGLSKTSAEKYGNHADLHNFLEKMNIEKAIIMGLSLGGKIAIDFALKYPEQVAALILVSPGLNGYDFKSKQFIENNEKLRKAFNEGNVELAIEYFQRSWTDGPHRTPSQVDPVVREKVKAMAINTANNWNREATEYIPIPLAIKRISDINHPILAVVGDLDMPGILEIVDMIEENTPNTQKVVIPGVAHMVNMEKPEEFNRVILDYLSKLQLPKP